MISHFLRRDFQSNRMVWGIFAIAIVGLSLAPGLRDNIVFLLGCSFVFASILTGNLAGSNWRNQHAMSRNYILALPVERKKLFLILQIRGSVYWIPTILIGLAAPILLSPHLAALINYSDRLLYLVVLVSMSLTLINSSLSMGIGVERVTNYLSQSARLFGMAKAFFQNFLSFGLQAACVAACFKLQYWALAGAIFSILVTWICMRRARKDWIGY